jgi:hypothetical protein
VCSSDLCEDINDDNKILENELRKTVQSTKSNRLLESKKRIPDYNYHTQCNY